MKTTELNEFLSLGELVKLMEEYNSQEFYNCPECYNGKTKLNFEELPESFQMKYANYLKLSSYKQKVIFLYCKYCMTYSVLIYPASKQ
jgi:hypothetical protein